MRKISFRCTQCDMKLRLTSRYVAQSYSPVSHSK
jgi:hypothetical protein